jgi:hypothetical protein
MHHWKRVWEGSLRVRAQTRLNRRKHRRFQWLHDAICSLLVCHRLIEGGYNLYMMILIARQYLNWILLKYLIIYVEIHRQIIEICIVN